MNNTIAATGATLALLTAIIGGTITVESRYAKRAEVQSQIDTIRAWALGILFCVAIGLCTYALIIRANVKLEARCLASGGTIVTAPGRISMCAQP